DLEQGQSVSKLRRPPVRRAKPALEAEPANGVGDSSVREYAYDRGAVEALAVRVCGADDVTPPCVRYGRVALRSQTRPERGTAGRARPGGDDANSVRRKARPAGADDLRTQDRARAQQIR